MKNCPQTIEAWVAVIREHTWTHVDTQFPDSFFQALTVTKISVLDPI